MSAHDPDTIARNRFVAMNLARIGGTVIVLIGLAIWQTDLVAPGGIPWLGFGLALIGLVLSFFSPKWLAARWRTPPEP